MQIGCTFPQDEIGNDPAAIRDFAQAAEALGYSHIMIYDHVLGAVHAGRTPPLTGPYTEHNAFHEPFVTFGFLAAVTTRIQLCTGIVILPQRQAVLVAKQAAEVDLLSRGRLRLGVGTGWNYVEYQGLNQGWEDRGARYEEQLVLLRRLWEEPVLDYTGRYHRIDRAGILPLPGRRIPVWLGGARDIVLRRAAKFGDGMIFSAGGPRSIASVEVVRDYVRKEGRDPAAFGIEGILEYSAGPDKWGPHLENWRKVGADYACIRTIGERPVGAEVQIAALRRYAEAVGLKPAA
ncbi:MAG: LLM class F420-dependent oxidoreductase [Gammaproteobacteria bacterium]